MAILILAEHDLGPLSPAMGRLVAAAGALGGSIDGLVVGQNAGIVAEQAARLAGVARVRTAEAVPATAETLVPLLARLAPDD